MGMDYINEIIQGDVVAVLRQLPEQSIHLVCTSPPYWNLRRYGEGKWEGGDPTCEHKTGRAARGGYDNGKQSTNRGSGLGAGEDADTCGLCGARRVEAETSVVWPSVSYRPMSGLPELLIPAWKGELGQEPTPEAFIAHLVLVFREVKRVLRNDATAWINMGDSYNGSGKGPAGTTSQLGDVVNGAQHLSKQRTNNGSLIDGRTDAPGLKNGDMCGIPWRLAFALQADGWFLRSEIIWHKNNPMPGSYDDRPTTAHEQIFMLAKSNKVLYWTHTDGRVAQKQPKPDYQYRQRETGVVVKTPPENWKREWVRENLWQGHSYYFDQEGVREPLADSTLPRMLRGVSETHKNINGAPGQTPHSMNRPRKKRKYADAPKSYAANGSKMAGHKGIFAADGSLTVNPLGRNIRSVWTLTSEHFSGAHYATFPSKLPERCIKAGCPERVCRSCGAPHVRLVEKQQFDRTGDRLYGGTLGHNPSGKVPNSNTRGMPDPKVEFIGWQSTCACGEATFVGGLVLDIFSGSGTTALKARQLGRRYVGIEINPEYHAMSLDRLRLPFEKRVSKSPAPASFTGPDTKGGNTTPMWEVV